MDKSLNLCLNFTQVSDVSMLGNVRILRLRGCKEIREFGALCNVHALDLSQTLYMSMIHVTPLYGVYALNVSECDDPCEYSLFKNLHILRLGKLIWRLETPLSTITSDLRHISTVDISSYSLDYTTFILRNSSGKTTYFCVLSLLGVLPSTSVTNGNSPKFFTKEFAFTV